MHVMHGILDAELVRLHRTIKRVKRTVSWHFARCIFSSPFSSPFLILAPSPMTSPSLLHLSASQSTSTLQGWFCFGRLAERHPCHRLQVQVSPRSQQRAYLDQLREQGVFCFYTDDLAPKVDAFLMLNTIDLGRLTSSLLSQERKVLSHSVFLIFRHIQTWRDPHAGHRSVLQHGVGDLSFFSRFGKPLS